MLFYVEAKKLICSTAICFTLRCSMLWGGGGVKHSILCFAHTTLWLTLHYVLYSTLCFTPSPPSVLCFRVKRSILSIFEHSTLGFASQRSFLRKAKQGTDRFVRKYWSVAESFTAHSSIWDAHQICGQGGWELWNFMISRAIIQDSDWLILRNWNRVIENKPIRF